MKPTEMYDEMVDSIFSESREQTISNQKIEKISETYKVNDYVDSIYYANGWMDESRYYNDYYYEEQFSDELDQRVEEAEAAVDEEMEDEDV